MSDGTFARPRTQPEEAPQMRNPLIAELVSLGYRPEDALQITRGLEEMLRQRPSSGEMPQVPQEYSQWGNELRAIYQRWVELPLLTRDSAKLTPNEAKSVVEDRDGLPLIRPPAVPTAREQPWDLGTSGSGSPSLQMSSEVVPRPLERPSDETIAREGYRYELSATAFRIVFTSTVPIESPTLEALARALDPSSGFSGEIKVQEFYFARSASAPASLTRMYEWETPSTLGWGSTEARLVPADVLRNLAGFVERAQTAAAGGGTVRMAAINDAARWAARESTLMARGREEAPAEVATTRENFAWQVDLPVAGYATSGEFTTRTYRFVFETDRGFDINTIPQLARQLELYPERFVRFTTYEIMPDGSLERREPLEARGAFRTIVLAARDDILAGRASGIDTAVSLVHRPVPRPAEVAPPTAVETPAIAEAPAEAPTVAQTFTYRMELYGWRYEFTTNTPYDPATTTPEQLLADLNDPGKRAAFVSVTATRPGERYADYLAALGMFREMLRGAITLGEARSWEQVA